MGYEDKDCRNKEEKKKKQGNCIVEHSSKGKTRKRVNSKGRKRKEWKIKNIKIIPAALLIYPRDFFL